MHAVVNHQRRLLATTLALNLEMHHISQPIPKRQLQKLKETIRQVETARGPHIIHSPASPKHQALNPLNPQSGAVVPPWKTRRSSGRLANVMLENMKTKPILKLGRVTSLEINKNEPTNLPNQPHSSEDRAPKATVIGRPRCQV